MSSVRASYDEGFHLGVRYAEGDLHAQAPVDGLADELVQEAIEAREDRSRSWRAFKLGIARGYRDEVERHHAQILNFPTKEKT